MAKTEVTQAATTTNPGLPPVEVFDPFDGPASTAARYMPATAVAEPRLEQQVQQEQQEHGLADRMAISITENLDARRRTAPTAQGAGAASAKLADNVVIAAGRTWRTIKTSTRKPSRFLGQHLGWIWNKFVALLGAPPLSGKKAPRD